MPATPATASSPPPGGDAWHSPWVQEAGRTALPGTAATEMQEPPPIVVLVPDEEQARLSPLPPAWPLTALPPRLTREAARGKVPGAASASAGSDAAPGKSQSHGDRDGESGNGGKENEAAIAAAFMFSEVPFVRAARRKAFWRQRSVRALLACASLALLALLGLQVAVQERDQLAALAPRTLPWLQRLCEPLRCSIGPLRQPGAIVIEGSSLDKLHGGVYRLSLTLRNIAPLPVALPAIELALTDTQDRPVLRRVLRPAEYGAAPRQALEAGSEWSGGFTASITTEDSERIAGYRVLVFYL